MKISLMEIHYQGGGGEGGPEYKKVGGARRLA